MNATIAEFLLQHASEATELARRAEVIAALAQLSTHRREQLSRAVDAVCKIVAKHGGTARVRFGLTQRQGQRYLEVAVSEQPSATDQHAPNSGPQTQAVDHSETLAASSLQRLGELVDWFESSGWPFEGAVIRLAQALPPTFAQPSEAEVADWCQIVQANSPLDALALAFERARRLAAALGDAHDREQLQQELTRCTTDAETLKILSLVTTKTKNAVSIMDAEGVIRWVNNAFVQMTGYPSTEAIGKRLDELLFGPSTDAEAASQFRNALANGHEWSGDIMQYRRDGRTFWVESNLIPIHDATGKLTRWIAIDNDITKRHQIEEALRTAKEAAEASSRAKSELLANLSHEIRTPMNAIIGMTDLALATELTPEQREYLETARSSAESLLLLLNDILDLSKIEAGKLELEEVEFHLADLVRDTLKALAVKAYEKGLELNSHVSFQLPQYVRGDPTRLRQILFNLVGNAIKFTDQGEVEVDVAPEEIGTDYLVLHFSVRDTGIGIPREKRDKIFEAFAQGDASTTRRFGGTGLGLTITAELVRMMHGRIWVDSVVGEGTTFHFTVRLKPGRHRTDTDRSADMAKLRGKHVLVVDDHATNRRILAEILDHWGMITTLAESADAAIKELQRAAQHDETFDLLLLDGMMPDMDGFELACWLQEHPELKHGPLILLTSADQTNTATRCRELGIAAHLSKPISASSLLEVVLATMVGIEPHELATPPSSDSHDRPARTLRVLIADDHDANRRLAVTILRKRGHYCREAANGREAIELARREPFDVILMDIQMPGMDGFEATSAIRQMEQSTGRHVPIIALTAHAMSGDREACLAAGMDAYLAKPLRPRELVQLVESITTGSNIATSPPSYSEKKDTAKPEFDFDAALESLDHDMELLLEQMQFFLNDGPDLIERIGKAIDNNEPRSLEIAAHRLKSLLARYAYHAAADLAYQLERQGKQGSVAGAREAYNQLVPKVHELVAAIRNFMRHHQ